eukprot:9466946-Pyramimonas_sp.AAC.1
MTDSGPDLFRGGDPDPFEFGVSCILYASEDRDTAVSSSYSSIGCVLVRIEESGSAPGKRFGPLSVWVTM